MLTRVVEATLKLQDWAMTDGVKTDIRTLDFESAPTSAAKGASSSAEETRNWSGIRKDESQPERHFNTRRIMSTSPRHESITVVC